VTAHGLITKVTQITKITKAFVVFVVFVAFVIAPSAVTDYADFTRNRCASPDWRLTYSPWPRSSRVHR
jgi:hypothetical protein